jgi:hypothetical protein
MTCEAHNAAAADHQLGIAMGFTGNQLLELTDDKQYLFNGIFEDAKSLKLKTNALENSSIFGNVMRMSDGARNPPENFYLIIMHV